jgi:hypothetical protein
MCPSDLTTIMRINRSFMVVESDPYSHTRHMVKYEEKKKAINGVLGTR